MIINEQELPHLLVAACMEVHRILGPGLLRTAYVQALHSELRMQEFSVEGNKLIDIDYKGLPLIGGSKIDLIVEEKIGIGIFATEALTQLDKTQLRTALQLANLDNGFLINFSSPDLRKGIKRIVLGGEGAVLAASR